MYDYQPPLRDMQFILAELAGLDDISGLPGCEEASADVIGAVLEEAGRFAAGVLAPLNRVGDEQGCRLLEDGRVAAPEGWQQAYARFCAAGWLGLSLPVEFGGQGLPKLASTPVMEMWNAANMAFTMLPILNQGQAEALRIAASAEQKRTWLPRVVSGEWGSTMNLTEPQAGSDLNALRARAEPAGDGTYRIFGQKIFITYGEHDFTDNIVHLVLARLPDAPPGTRGISLFLVPKFLVEKDGSLGRRNDVFCASIEHKLGIHASPTCTMIYGDGFAEDGEPGAVGWLVGEENRGLACMFTMMNNARLAVGIQGVAVAETAFQKALAYARERRQGRASGHKGEGMSPIAEHPDVARDLLTMKSLTRMARAIAYACAHAIDMAGAASGDAARDWSERANLLTPVAKAFSTDVGVDVASIGVQVHGGMGYIEETGAAALLRDARIAPIYEGTNGIQAIDLVMRKLPLSGGAQVAGYIAELRGDVEAIRASNLAGFGRSADRIAAALDDLEAATAYLAEQTKAGNGDTALAGATPYLRLFGLAAGGAYLARAAVSGGEDERIALCRFAAENLLTETPALRDRVTEGAESLAAAARQVA